MSSHAALAARSGLDGERIVAWVVLVLLAACVSLTLYDLYLVLSALR